MELSGNPQNLKLDGPRLRRRPPPKTSQTWRKNRPAKKHVFFFSKAKVGLKVEPKTVKIGSRRVFCVTEKTLNSASVFFALLLFLGRPGRRKSSISLANTIIFAKRPFLKNNNVFYKTMSKLIPSATPKTIGNLKNLIFTTVEIYVFFCYCFLNKFVGKWPPFLEVSGSPFGVILQRFFPLWLPRPHVCKKA